MYWESGTTLEERIEWVRYMAWREPNVHLIPFRDIDVSSPRLHYIKKHVQPWLRAQGPRYQRSYWYFDETLGYDLSNVYAIFGIRPKRRDTPPSDE
jgi:hypothetical protein